MKLWAHVSPWHRLMSCTDDSRIARLPIRGENDAARPFFDSGATQPRSHCGGGGQPESKEKKKKGQSFDQSHDRDTHGDFNARDRRLGATAAGAHSVVSARRDVVQRDGTASEATCVTC